MVVMDIPEFVNSLDDLEIYSRLLTIDHLGSIAESTEWLSLETSATIGTELIKMCDAGFDVSHIRTHCLSGVLVRNLKDAEIEIVGICFTHPNYKGTKYYIDCLFTKLEGDSELLKIEIMELIESIFGEYNWKSYAGGKAWLGRNKSLGLVDKWEF